MAAQGVARLSGRWGDGGQVVGLRFGAWVLLRRYEAIHPLEHAGYSCWGRGGWLAPDGARRRPCRLSPQLPSPLRGWPPRTSTRAEKYWTCAGIIATVSS